MRRQVIEQAALFTWDICALSVFYGYFILLQTLRWCCVDCMIHHERDVREEQKCMYVARTSNKRVIPMEWSWWVSSNNACEPGEQLIVLANGDDENDLVGWSLLLLAATVRSFAHMPLGISDRNNIMCNDQIDDLYKVFSNWKVRESESSLGGNKSTFAHL